jgi:hypothetical protein
MSAVREDAARKRTEVTVPKAGLLLRFATQGLDVQRYLSRTVHLRDCGVAPSILRDLLILSTFVFGDLSKEADISSLELLGGAQPQERRFSANAAEPWGSWRRGGRLDDEKLRRRLEEVRQNTHVP